MNYIDARNKQRLMRRYLIWCYKTTKEDLDRIDRYFTQLEVDQFILESFMKHSDYSSLKFDKKYKELVDEFKKYMNVKKENVLKQKYKNSDGHNLLPQYVYLQNRFKAIERAIVRFLGKSELKKIIDLYEQEMTTRILQAREH